MFWLEFDSSFVNVYYFLKCRGITEIVLQVQKNTIISLRYFFQWFIISCWVFFFLLFRDCLQLLREGFLSSLVVLTIPITVSTSNYPVYNPFVFTSKQPVKSTLGRVHLLLQLQLVWIVSKGLGSGGKQPCCFRIPIERSEKIVWLTLVWV